MIVHGVDLFDRQDMVVAAMQRTGSFEDQSMAAWLECAKPGAVMIDVGAYSGLYAIAAARAGAMVVAFEPNPTVYQRLQKNVEHNGVGHQVVTLPYAVGEEPGRETLWLRNGPMTSAGRLDGSKGGRGVTVEVVPLNDDWENVTAVKLDVEGSELAALRGARDLLERRRPLVIAEALTDQLADQLQEYMEGLGYRHTMADGRNMIFRVACDG